MDLLVVGLWCITMAQILTTWTWTNSMKHGAQCRVRN